MRYVDDFIQHKEMCKSIFVYLCKNKDKTIRKRPQGLYNLGILKYTILISNFSLKIQ